MTAILFTLGKLLIGSAGMAVCVTVMMFGCGAICTTGTGTDGSTGGGNWTSGTTLGAAGGGAFGGGGGATKLTSTALGSAASTMRLIMPVEAR